MVALTRKATNMVDSALLNKAIAALLKHHNESSEKSNALLGNDIPVHVQFTLDRIPEATSSKPIRVPIPHPLHKVLQEGEESEGGEEEGQGLEEVEVCLIVKDDAKESIKEMIEKFPQYMSTIKKVLTLTSLRKKYTQYKDRRELLKRYDIFLADDRILPMLGKALGKNFFQEKKQPVPIKLTRREALPYAIRNCLSSTFLWISPGTCVAVKAGNTAMPLDHLVKNVESILEHAVGHIPRKWSNVAAVNVKTSQSVALPVYNKTKEELMEIAKMAKIEKSEDNKMKRAREEDDAEDADADAAAKDVQKKKRKKELAAKSPLVKALKKQNKAMNEEEEDASASAAAAASKTPSKKKKKPRSDSVEENSNDVMKTPKSTKKKKTKAADEEGVGVVDEPKSANKKKTKAAADDGGEEATSTTDAPKSAKKKKKTKAEAVDEEEPTTDAPKSSKKKKKTNDETAAAEKKKEESSDFVRSKKFKGSKKGYVFKMGDKGLGYYIDVKPIPDPSLRRKNTGGRRKSVGGNNKRSKSSGRRGRRSL